MFEALLGAMKNLLSILNKYVHIYACEEVRSMKNVNSNLVSRIFQEFFENFRSNQTNLYYFNCRIDLQLGDKVN